MQHLKLTFENIMQPEILFYDKKMEAACFDICGHLKIDNMPAINGKNYYELHNKQFKKKTIGNVHKLYLDDSVFSPALLKKFRVNNHNVLFVFEENVLRGVVHISDYNRNNVLESVQDDLLAFERKLRQLILLNGFKNEDMQDFFLQMKNSSKDKNEKNYYARKIKSYDYRINEINNFGQFQLFEFSDLMNFAENSFSKVVHQINDYSINGKQKTGKEILRELRNLVMHGKNPVTKENEKLIYSIRSLQGFMESLLVLRIEYGAVINKIRQHPDYLKAIELENRSKLDIIHNHHPKALEYFLEF
jgi:hypothetical protein